jgi:hypothetical protein
MPTDNESGSVLQPTTNQFIGFVSFGAIPGLTSNTWRTVSNNAALRAGSSNFNGTLARIMGLPIGTSNNIPSNGPVAIILRQGRIGAPYLNRQISFAFGAIVAAPATDENGVSLPPNLAADYWQPKPYPYAANGQTNTSYYWSPHAEKVYASQAGPIQIVWMKAAYLSSRPADYTNALTGATNYYENGGNYFRLYPVDYIVSGSPIKPPRTFYWTERGFAGLGKSVAVPAAQVGDVAIVYNRNFPKTVTTSYVGPGDTVPGGTTNQVLQELRTLWWDKQQGYIFAYNSEGRIFMELLGDLHSDGVTREPLGFEIVDVFKSPTPLDTTVELGEAHTPPLPDPQETLTPKPIYNPALRPSPTSKTSALAAASSSTPPRNHYP